MTEPINSSSKFALVTASDSIPLKYNGVVKACRGISFAVAGDLAVVDDVGNAVIIPSGSLAAGVIHPIVTPYVRATGTAATGIVAYF